MVGDEACIDRHNQNSGTNARCGFNLRTALPTDRPTDGAKRAHRPANINTDLREALLEVVVQNVRLLRHHGEGNVVAHAERALLSCLGHVRDLFQPRRQHGQGLQGGGAAAYDIYFSWSWP